MLLFTRSTDAAAVPVGLLTAAIDLINIVKPQPRDIDDLVTSMALRLDFDQKTASALMARIRATARMFANPAWPAIRQLGLGLSLEQRLIFEAAVQRFIATSPLNRDGCFDLAVLTHELTEALPSSGRG